MSISAPDVPIKPRRRKLYERFSVVWLVPIVALLIALGVAYQSYSEKGPVVVIAFDAATGVKAGETELRYRDITVGLVEKVAFSPSLEKVEVTVRLDKTIGPYVDGDASFWVVRPEVSARGVTGLDTVLSGVFIEGLWDSDPWGLVAYHEGLANAPLLRVGEKGLQISLRATEDTVLSEDTPILYKGIVVGRTGKPQLIGDGSEAVVDAIIYSPHDKLVTTSTRFWDTSGFSFKIGPGGAELDFSSLASLISGGVTFETIVSGGVPIASGVEFSVYTDETTARASVFADASGPPLEIATIFSENVSGLTAGSPVELGGVRVGEVTSLRGLVNEERFGDSRVRLMATMAIRPERLGLGEAVTPDEALAYLKSAATQGLRARLATASILTGGLKIELLRLTNAPEAELEQTEGNIPTLPSTEANIKDVAATAEGVLKRVNDLPIEELLGSVIAFLDSAKSLIGNDDLQRAPGEIVGLVEDARGLIGSEQVQALPADLSALMASLQAATTDIQGILTKLNEADAVNRLLAAVDAAGAAAGAVGTTLDGVPNLITQINALAAKATALPLERLLAEATTLAASASTLLASEATQALPEGVNTLLTTLNTATADLQLVIAQINETDAVGRLMTAVDAAGTAAAEVGTAITGVPALIAKFDTLAAKANALPVEELLAEATSLTASAKTLLASEATQALPDNVNVLLGSLNKATDDLQVVLAQVSEADSVNRLLAAVDAASSAATNVGTAVEGVPELITQINALAAKASALPVETLISEATKVMTSAEQLLSQDSIQALPESANTLMAGLNSATADLRLILIQITENDTVSRLLSAIDAAGAAASGVNDSLRGVPDLITKIDALAAKANALPVETLVSEASGVMAAAQTLLAQDSTKALPANLNAALTDLQSVISEITTQEGVSRLLAAVDAAGDAAAKAGTSFEGVPALVDQISAVAEKANALPLDQLVNEITSVMTSADAILASEGAQELPASLTGALTQIENALADLRAGGTVENVNRTLASAANAADSIAQATGTLPGVIQRVNSLINQASKTLASFDGDSQVNRDVRSALRQVERAAEALSSLARAIERRPNSIILGR